jgi:sortase (surface protein transpeptidase)
MALTLVAESLAAVPAPVTVAGPTALGQIDGVAAPAPTPAPVIAVTAVDRAGLTRPRPDGGQVLDFVAPIPEPTAKPQPVVKKTSAPTVKPKPAAPKATPAPTSKPKAAPTYKGTNRVWIPALGINRSIAFFACTSNAYPGDKVYRWGCAGENNVYLFGHAHSVFKPLHDAYVRGNLKKGMKVIYADSSGKVRTYEVSWWKVVAPDKGDFAFAALSSPGMTLQTCVGSKSQYRLVVRLALAD